MRILAVSSGGGHWVELVRLCKAWQGHQAVFVTVHRSYATDVPGARFYVINDATRWNKFGLILLAARLVYILIRERPDVVVTTGAAPGYLALRIGKMLGARTVWIDSIANAEELSLSGQYAGPYADLWLTQWAHLARPDGPRYEGAVI
ncbi:MAG: UDP-N-acetylglucosamine--LPS N-acetylglucosamine transferase [Phycisphaerae bacterium]|jgi:UDP-N-acetylglucosamine:LPS N-acetylglucosamine transferase